jgi:hypothetical protein
MLTVDNRYAFTMSAGEPLIFEVVFKDADGQTLNLDDRSFVLAFYKVPRTTIKILPGEVVTTGSEASVAFYATGDLSEELYLTTSGLVEFSERLRDGRNVIFKGTFSIQASAEGIETLDNQVIARRGVRMTLVDKLTAVDTTTDVFEYANIPLPSTLNIKWGSDFTPSSGVSGMDAVFAALYAKRDAVAARGTTLRLARLSLATRIAALGN